ncbi:hypothetical protein [Dendronalium sp. ChiSLP03b]|uniref:hypothetical protein n=1 Tax=Dendronalium sp. ChiSLP03b TaxID=3075381 RepID=UPI00391DF12E
MTSKNIAWRFQSDIEQGTIEIFYNTEVITEARIFTIPVTAPLVIESNSPEAIAFLQMIDEVINQTEPLPPTPKPNWGNFNRDMYPDPGYARVRLATTNQDAKTTMEALTIATGVAGTDLKGQDLIFFQFQWNLVIDGLPEGQLPTTEEIERWKAIAVANDMNFSFGDDAKIIINS